MLVSFSKILVDGRWFVNKNGEICLGFILFSLKKEKKKKFFKQKKKRGWFLKLKTPTKLKKFSGPDLVHYSLKGERKDFFYSILCKAKLLRKLRNHTLKEKSIKYKIEILLRNSFNKNFNVKFINVFEEHVH